MRKLILLLFLSTCICNIHAIKLSEGSLHGLAQAGVANFEVDYTNAIIHGMTDEEFAQYELDWDKDQYQIIAKFLGNLNDRTGRLLSIVKGWDTIYTVRWVVLNISTHGDIISELHVVGENGEIEAKIVDIKADGGRVGSKLNLIKDGAEESGKRVGSYLKRQIKKVK